VGSMTGRTVLALGLGLASLAGCHGGGGNRSGALTASEHKYCTLVKQFQDHLPARTADPQPEQFEAAMTEALQRNAKYFDDLQKVAPDEIRADVEKAIATLHRVAGGDISAYEGLDLTKADQWEEDHCR